MVFGRGRYGLLGPQPEHLRGRKTLVLDLDETLVHSQFNQVRNPDYTIPVDIEGRTSNIYVMKRPGAEYFLEQMAKYFEVVIYTASLSKVSVSSDEFSSSIQTNLMPYLIAIIFFQRSLRLHSCAFFYFLF